MRVLGRSGVRVSEICLGTMMFGGPTDADESNRIIASARDHGINFIDTADVYTGGRSEEITGRAIAADRDYWVLATKLGNAYRGEAAIAGTGGLSRRWIMTAADASLKRLGLDHIDILYVHRTDPSTDLDETITAFGDLIRAGKTRYWALSNVRAWQIADIVHRCRALGVPQPVALQPYYNLMNRQPEVEVLPAARAFGLGVATYSPLARGILTGKYTADAQPANDTRAGRGDKRMLEAEWRPESLAIADELKAHAAATGRSLIHFAMRWVLNNRTVTSIIAGPRTFAQWESYLGYQSAEWTADDEALVDRLVPIGHPSAHGASDPSYPIEGRFPFLAAQPDA